MVTVYNVKKNSCSLLKLPSQNFSFPNASAPPIQTKASNVLQKILNKEDTMFDDTQSQTICYTKSFLMLCFEKPHP